MPGGCWVMLVQLCGAYLGQLEALRRSLHVERLALLLHLQLVCRLLTPPLAGSRLSLLLLPRQHLLHHGGHKAGEGAGATSVRSGHLGWGWIERSVCAGCYRRGCECCVQAVVNHPPSAAAAAPPAPARWGRWKTCAPWGSAHAAGGETRSVSWAGWLVQRCWVLGSVCVLAHLANSLGRGLGGRRLRQGSVRVPWDGCCRILFLLAAAWVPWDGCCMSLGWLLQFGAHLASPLLFDL